MRNPSATQGQTGCSCPSTETVQPQQLLRFPTDRGLQDFYQKTVDVCGASHGGVDILDLGRLVARLQERLENGVKSKIVFCHNDLQVMKSGVAVVMLSRYG